MGVVYKAEDTKLKRTVALKFLPPELTSNIEARERFIHEAQAASALEHNNICTIYEIDETEDNQMFIAMAYYEGETLKKQIEKGPLELEKALDISVQIAQGLAKAQGKGVVHRDIKASNVIVTNDGTVKILDFGLAKLAGTTRITRTGTTMGTAAYMSPEQVHGKGIDHRTDIWSLGVVLYEMLTGQLPFKGENEQAIIYSILNEEPEPISSLRTDVPRELEQIISKALVKDPKERYQHADEFLTEIQRMAKNLGIKPAWQIPKWLSLRRRKWIASPLLWLSIIVVVGVAVGLLLFYPARAIPFQERDWILISDFENLTGDDVFDKSLNAALSVSIEQSRYLNVLPRRRINDVLRRMKKEGVEHIDESVGREIAVREGIKVILVLSISRVGDTYALIGVIENPATGESYKSELVHAKGKNEVLSALDELSGKIRRDLGETLSAIAQQNKPLVEATTSSLEALKQYSLGHEYLRKANFDEAKMYFESALRIDPSFTGAQASLGMLHFEISKLGLGTFDPEKGKDLLKEAVKDLDGLTEREKYGILAFHALAVKRSPQEAVEHTKVLLGLYPEYSAAHNNLGRYYEQMGRYDEAIAAYKEAIRIDPYLMLSYNSLVNIYIDKMSDLESALEWCKRQLIYNDRHIWAYNNLGRIYLGKDDLEQAQEAFKKTVEINPQFSFGLFSLGHTCRLQGQYDEALHPLKKILEINPEEPNAHYQLGVLYQLMEDAKSARRHFEKYHDQAKKWVKDNPTHGYSHICLALALTRLGQKEQGWSMGQKAMTLDPNEHFGYAQLLSAQGKKQEAIDQLERAVQEGYGNHLWIKIHPDFQPLYNEPRFQELVRRGLKQ